MSRRIREGAVKTARGLALDTLLKVETEGAYSNLQLNRSLQAAGLSRADASLSTELVYGTIQRQLTLDYWLGQFVAKGLRKLEPWVLVLLRMSLYQLLFLDRIPPHAAVNEAVTIAKKHGHAGIAGMVNGVLRSAVRRLDELKAAAFETEPPLRRIALRHSYPEWLVSRWLDAYGEEVTEAICASGNEAPHGSLRVNRLRMSRSEALAKLAEEGYDARESSASEAGVIVERGGNLAQTDGYASGLWSVQDESSMLVAEAAAPLPGFRVLDCCAAPGGKSTHMAELMGDEGTVIANDLHAHKRALIAEQAERLGLTSVEAATGDAALLGSMYPAQSFDLVLLDAPCSGFGVIRRKPEIKWTKSPQDVKAIADLQTTLLDGVCGLVRPGGVLMYSTCTIERDENERQVAAFLERHPEFELDPQWPEALLQRLRAAGAAAADFRGAAQILPQHYGSDGFFIARLRRRA
ncbi:16S rRNA (cytosine(967)-C(5))-methyltransferase RsmB [Paenibacillus beijingensis]|uniref:16S rRNA (cytosine(967)-C(5))-methyltransferase n=1 Tax=Paenibacillus beijingensis TaxID=1126833 RepID=A0A0D5NMA2_9BACL|nr:16S rRNA (cytosine(967)-C(5))-methyltransferase RsmB [Paenibacillus beijingensis]AJY76459.1 16S rRNA methyltransferase [Paenibacillus beijingensis]